MTTKSVTDATLLEVLAKLEPGEDLDESLRKLLLERARNKLLKYRLMDQGFQKEYGQDFFSFKGSGNMARSSFKVEQDYCDWELAVTMIEELEIALKLLQRDAG